jgi:hypothetical protein
VLEDTGCVYEVDGCDTWEDIDDTYIQGTNTSTDFAIEAEVSNDTVATSSYDGHTGPDIDDIELVIQHNEVTTTTETIAATTAVTTAVSEATTTAEAVVYEYCWQKTPSTCAGDQQGMDDIEEDLGNAIVDIETEVITVVDVTNLDVVELVIVDVTLDEAITQELSVEPDTTFEEAFTNIIEEAGLEEEFSSALAEENITEEEFFSEVEAVMEEEMVAPTPTVEAPVESPVEEETPVETEVAPETAPVEEEEVMNTAGSEETIEAPTETPVEEEAVVEEEIVEEVVEEEITEEVTEEEAVVEEEEVTEEEAVVEEEVTEEEVEETEVEEESDDTSVDEVEIETQVEEIQASIERVIARVEANLTRIDLKLKATSFVLAKAMQDQQPDMTGYMTQSFYDPTQIPDNRDWYADDTMLDAYNKEIYQDRDLRDYTANDPLEQHEEAVTATNNNISRIEAELEELENELNE